MINTIWAIVLPSAASIWNIIVSRTFFQSSHSEGAAGGGPDRRRTNMRLFVKIILPLSMPIIAVMALFYGVGNWNSYFSALIYLNDAAKYPLQLVLRQILVLQEMGAQGGGAIDSSTAIGTEHQGGNRGAGQICRHHRGDRSGDRRLSVLQRYFVQGVMIGSIKG